MSGSRQLREYLQLRSEGVDRAEAADAVGMGAEEARLTDIANERGEIDLPPWPNDHNQPPEEEPVMAEGNVAADELRQLIERWERLDEEKKAIAEDQKDVLGEAKARGYDVATIRRVLKLRKMDSHKRDEAAALLDTYASALGMQGVLL